MERDIAIIGAGLTGLTTAYYLNKASKDFIVIEKENRVGGVINSITQDGFICEPGPNTGVLGSIEAEELFEDIKDVCRVEIASSEASNRYIMKNNKWERLPNSLVTGITTNLFTFKDKLRLLAEPFRGRGNKPDETVAELVLRRMGKSFLDYAVDPFIAGIYAGNPNLLVTKYALPKLYNLEQNYGSFIMGSIKKAKYDKKNNVKNPSKKIFSTEGGLKNLTDSLYSLAGKEKFVLGASDMRIEYVDNKFKITVKEDIIYANKLVCTIPAYNLKGVLDFIPVKELEVFDNLEYAPIVSVGIGFKEWRGFNLDGFGGLVPSKENKKFLGVLFLSSFLKDRAPQAGALINVFMGGIRNKELFGYSDNEIIKVLEKEVMPVMNLKDFKPDLFKISRYKYSIPQYYADSGNRFNKTDELEKRYKGLFIAGNLKDGIGMSDRIKQAKNISNKL